MLNLLRLVLNKSTGPHTVEQKTWFSLYRPALPTSAKMPQLENNLIFQQAMAPTRTHKQFLMADLVVWVSIDWR